MLSLILIAAVTTVNVISSNEKVENVIVNEVHSSGEQVTSRIEVSNKVNGTETAQLSEDTKIQFQNRLGETLDEKKQKVVENLNESLNKKNEKWVENWNSVIERLNKILAKIEKREGELASQGKDTSALKTKIAVAKTAISKAQSLVNSQASKVYTIEFTSEKNLGRSVSSAISELRGDLKATKEDIALAKKAVVAATVELAHLLGEEVKINE